MYKCSIKDDLRITKVKNELNTLKKLNDYIMNLIFYGKNKLQKEN